MKKYPAFLIILIFPHICLYPLGFSEYSPDELLQFVPESYSSEVYYINMRKLSNTVLFDQFINTDNNYLYKKLNSLGIDFRNDVYSLIYAENNKNAGLEDAIAVINLTYQKSTIVTVLNDNAVQESYNGKIIYNWFSEIPGSQSIYFADNSIIIAGSSSAVKECINSGKSLRGAFIGNSLTDNTFLWGRFLITEDTKIGFDSGGNNDLVNDNIAMITQMADSIVFNIDFDYRNYIVNINLLNNDQEENLELAGILNTVKAILLFTNEIDDKTKQILLNMKISGQNNGVNISILMSEDLLLRVIKNEKTGR